MALALPALVSFRRAITLLCIVTAVMLILGCAVVTLDFDSGTGIFRQRGSGAALRGGGIVDGWKGQLGWGSADSAGRDAIDSGGSDGSPTCRLLWDAEIAYDAAFSASPHAIPGPTTFLPYTFSHAMLIQTLRAYAAARYPNLLVLDNSASGSAWAARQDLARRYGARVVRTPTRLRFSQLMSMMDDLASCKAGSESTGHRRDEVSESDSGKRKADARLPVENAVHPSAHTSRSAPGALGYYLWSHTDVLLLSGPEGDAYQRVQHAWEDASDALAKGHAHETDDSDLAVSLGETWEERKRAAQLDQPTARGAKKDSRGLGVLFFQYDRLSAVSTGLRGAAPWDVVVGQYGADCDRYARVRLAGYTIADGPSTVPQSDTEENRRDSGFRLVHVHAVLTTEEMEVLYGPPSDTPSDLRLPLDDAVAYIEAASARAGEYAWRNGGQVDNLDAVHPADEAAARAEKSASDEYLNAKWGEGWDCPLEGRQPAWDYQWA